MYGIGFWGFNVHILDGNQFLKANDPKIIWAVHANKPHGNGMLVFLAWQLYYEQAVFCYEILKGVKLLGHFITWFSWAVSQLWHNSKGEAIAEYCVAVCRQLLGCKRYF